MKVGKIIGRIFAVLFVVVLIFLLGRIFMMDDKGSLTEIVPTEAAKEAYAVRGKDAFVTHKILKSLSADGYFSMHSLIYNEDGRELQITGRYNESVYKYLDVENGDGFYWELRDSAGNTVSVGTVAEEEEKYFYRHFRLIFSDVAVTKEEPLYLFLCCDAVEYPTTNTEGLPVHSAGQDWKSYKLSKQERSTLS